MNRPQIFAHRGAKAVAPENTLPAFQRALDMDVDGIELDVQASRDGQLVVIHDFYVDKTTNGTGAVRSFTAAELAALDAGSHFGAEFAGVGVPTLAEVFDLVGDRCRVNVEIKSEDPEGGPEVELLAALIRGRNLYDQVIVSSFNPITLVKLRYTDPKVQLGLLYFAPLPPHLRQAWFTPILQPEAIHPHYNLVDDDAMTWAHARGCAINTWTVNEPATARRLAQLGVSAIITDVPDIIARSLREA